MRVLRLEMTKFEQLFQRFANPVRLSRYDRGSVRRVALYLENVLGLQQLVKETGLTTSSCPNSLRNGEWDLVAGCRNGDLSAFEQLYQMHAARMKSIACNLLRNASDAEDAVQETFLKTYRGVANFKGSSSLSTWIYRILVNVCYDLRRRRGRSREISGETTPGHELDAPGGVTDHPLRLTLEACLDRLSPRPRTVFVLFEVEGFRHREIAEILEIPEGTSKNLLFEAKRELRRLIFGSGKIGKFNDL